MMKRNEQITGTKRAEFKEENYSYVLLLSLASSPIHPLIIYMLVTILTHVIE